MTTTQIENMKKFFGMKRNKERLLALLKSEGEYVEFKEKKGFIYAMKIGESEGMDVMLKVSMLAGKFEILDAFIRITPGVEYATTA